MDNWNQIEQQSNTKAKRIRLEQVFYFRVGVTGIVEAALEALQYNSFSMAWIYRDDILMTKRVNVIFLICRIHK